MEWLLARGPGFSQLSGQERNAIIDFALLWSLFEARILNNQGSAKVIRNVVGLWDEAGILQGAAYDAQLAYFRQRYFANGDFTGHFDHLHLRRNDMRPLVRAVISASSDDPVARVTTVLIIILRYRNNLFHGVKWSYELAGQLENFTHANNALMTALDHHGQLN
jgi:hypothetical protein